MVRIGLLGCGNIGHIIAQHAEGFVISAVYDKVPERAAEIAGICHGKAYGDFAAFLGADTDLIVEAASVSAARAHAREVLLHKKNLVIMSVGALTDLAFREDLMACQKNRDKDLCPEWSNFRAGQPEDRADFTDNKIAPEDYQKPAVPGP